MADVSKVWAEHIEVIESGYEFMLAYAAQGQVYDDPAGGGSQLRDSLEKMSVSLKQLAQTATQMAEEKGLKDYEAFVDALQQDAQKAQAGIRLVLGKPALSSQLIDNLNASIHLRTLLTDLFLIDEALK